MRVTLGTFACSELESQSGTDIPTGVREALARYAGKLASGSEPVAPPRFFGAGAGLRGSKIDLDLTVDADLEAVLEREAIRQGTTVSELAGHTVLAYLAELDSRRN